MIKLIGISCFIVLLINAEPKKKLELYLKIDKYPFIEKLLNCAMCFGFWFSIPITYYLFGLSINMISGIGIITIVAELINRQLNKF